MRPLKVLEHAVWTFVEAFLVVLIGAGVFDWDVALLEAALAVGALNVVIVVHQFAEYRRDKLAGSLPYADPGGVDVPSLDGADAGVAEEV